MSDEPESPSPRRLERPKPPPYQLPPIPPPPPLHWSVRLLVWIGTAVSVVLIGIFVLGGLLFATCFLGRR